MIEDSAFMRKVISDILSEHLEIEIIGMASNGEEGSSMAAALKPDVVVTDMVMPKYDGLHVVKSIMADNPVPIILLSSLEKSNLRIFDALENGAFEFIDKPADLDAASIRNYALPRLIKEASRADISLLKAKWNKKSIHHRTYKNTSHYDIVAIGASTGGPTAIEYIVSNLPLNTNIPVVIAQHMPARFLETFTERLNDQCALPVMLGRKGIHLKGGVIYIAPGEGNMKIERSVVDHSPLISFTQKKFNEFNFPSINCLFHSVAETYGNKSMGVILTGMGRDGAEGLSSIKAKGGCAVAQDEYTSIVYGMPKAAVEGGVHHILPLHDIPGFIASCL